MTDWKQIQNNFRLNRLDNIPSELAEIYNSVKDNSLWNDEDGEFYYTSYGKNALQAVYSYWKKPQKIKKGSCPRCDGYGRIDYYKHVRGGVCFKCNGSGQPINEKQS